MPYDPETQLRLAGAARNGDKHELLRLVNPPEVDATLNFVGTDYRLLHAAATYAHTEACRALLDVGADPNLRAFNQGHTALHSALDQAKDANKIGRHLACCKLLLEHGADPNMSNHTAKREVPLHLAVWLADRLKFNSEPMEIVRLLVQYGAKPGYVQEPSYRADGSEYLTPFQLAVKKGVPEVVRYFISECGEDPAQRTLGNKTMVQLAGKNQKLKEILRSAKIVVGVEAALDGQGNSGAPSVGSRKLRGMLSL